jgi:predicted TIM-barrel fold metal-dependent hydrolase
MKIAEQVPKPIIDTHIHFYQVTRAGGVPWPPRGNRILYRDVLPGDYKQVARPLGIVASGIVEASPLQRDNLWILDLIEDDPFFPFFVANLKLGSPEFVRNLDELMPYERFVGMRGSLAGTQAALDVTQLEHLKLLAERGLTLDLLSRGRTNPKARIDTLARTLPDLRIIIDHLGGAKSEQVDPQWRRDIERLGAHPNVVMKFSSFGDMFQPAKRQGDGWESPPNLSAYRAHFDVLMNAFGPDRLVWGSNWPVVLMGSTLAEQIRLAEEFLKPFGAEVRDKVMFGNALTFYRRRVP